jgi:glycosyltransferase involved in cell wall biosynthesis
MRIAAIVCVRNEQVHIARCLNDFVTDGIDVILIDNGSEDRTVDVARGFLGRGLLSIESLPWNGAFELGAQLALKKTIVAQLEHDWVIHADADEWMRPPAPETSLSAAIRRVDEEGFNCINFDEMVFVPWPEESFEDGNYVQRMTTYYFFEPRPLRLMRAWRRSIDADNTQSGGHTLRSGQLKASPESFVLRHYIALSLAHAVAKYVGRRFASDEIGRRWHLNRLGVTAANLVVVPSPYLKRLELWSSGSFDRSAPAKTHYWQWQDGETASIDRASRIPIPPDVGLHASE